ncbi:hypothetical protein DESPIG_02335 [Desulfovibrio piger ATCC 29098]|jgi:hypothetical protein|uniref:Uncharacterized protein n=1 Tax=Desulfovibrio piger ATCC 29098 TaxID=411464 RepID=B6WW66_9BACT|nr:hypothetical protein DESPIG_02335 [Desulfovibrio piger ATCC 29098]
MARADVQKRSVSVWRCQEKAGEEEVENSTLPPRLRGIGKQAMRYPVKNGIAFQKRQHRELRPLSPSFSGSQPSCFRDMAAC